MKISEILKFVRLINRELTQLEEKYITSQDYNIKNKIMEDKKIIKKIKREIKKKEANYFPILENILNNRE